MVKLTPLKKAGVALFARGFCRWYTLGGGKTTPVDSKSTQVAKVHLHGIFLGMFP